MALPLPERIGPYQIASLLGQGGMGTVYRARDTKLNRDVAIKVLLAEVAGDAERLARFSREAQLLASLNHPNIAHLYGLEGGDGPGGNVPAHLVMELVEGPTLADRISQGPIPFDEALPIARQIADALETAHEQGIIHRDLKPANIKVRPDGTVKVLDFGLAKAVDAADTTSGTGARDVTNSPTITSPAQMTRTGTILGTAAYMSPEQARGRAVDRRADIWAFGCVLYEVLTGRRAFEGDDVSITMASVLKDAVDWTALPADTPSAIRRLLRRCLEKDPRRRLSAIGDARIELDEAQTPSADAIAPPVVARSSRPRAAWLAFGVVTVLWIATLVPASKYFRTEERDAAQVRFTIPASDVSPQNYVVSWYPTISPDGQAIAYPGRIDTPPRSPEIPVADFDTGSDRIVWIRRLDTAQATPLAGTRGTRFQGAVPFWSADSHSLAFGSGTGLYRIDIDTGARQKICNVPGPVLSGTWGQDGTIVYADAAGGLYRVPATGGSPTEVVRPGGAVRAYRLPMFLPDSQHVIYQVTSVGVPPELHVRSLADGTSSVLAPSDSQAVYASGYLFFQRDGSLFAQLFDPDRRRLSGEARVVADGVYLSPNGRAAFDVSSTGTLVFRAGQAASLTSDLVWFNRKGETLGTIGDQLPYYQIRLSPDERRVAAIVVSATGNRMVMLDIPTRVTSRINEDTGVGGTNDPLWSPDGTTVAFESMRNKKHDFFERKLGTLSDTELYVSPDDPKWLDDWSHDGRFILFHASGGLFAFPLSGDRKPMSVIPPTSTTSLDSAHFSHDGKWFSFISKDASVWESWVASFPAADQRRQISSQGGGLPWWRADDKEIFYLSPDGKIMSVAVTKDPATGALDFKAPEMLFQSPLQAVLPTVDQYNVTGDGQRFLFIRPRMGEAQTPFNVIVNWTGSLRKPAPPSAQ